MKTKVKKSVILAGNPVPADWEFQKGIEETTGQPWEVRRWCINEYTGIKKYTRYLKYIFYPMYLAAGRSNRDYDFLRDAWSGHGESLCIISDRESARDTQTIHYEKNCHGDDYLRLLAQARAVIIPLRAGDFSSGQLVVLQAAMLGKPVIVTENDTIRDYIEDGITGFIIPKRKEALWDALQQLEDEKRYEQICRNAREKFVKDFSLYELGCRVGQQVRSV